MGQKLLTYPLFLLTVFQLWILYPWSAFAAIGKHTELPSKVQSSMKGSLLILYIPWIWTHLYIICHLMIVVCQLSYHKGQVHCLKNPVVRLHISLPLSTLGKHQATVPEYHKIKSNSVHSIFSQWVFHSVLYIYVPLYSDGLIASVTLVLRNIPFSCCVIVYSVILFCKFIFCSSRFWQLIHLFLEKIFWKE